MTEGDILLFDMHDTFGISEHNNVAAEHAHVIDRIRQYVKDNNRYERHVTMPEDQ